MAVISFCITLATMLLLGQLGADYWLAEAFAETKMPSDQGRVLAIAYFALVFVVSPIIAIVSATIAARQLRMRVSWILACLTVDLAALLIVAINADNYVSRCMDNSAPSYIADDKERHTKCRERQHPFDKSLRKWLEAAPG